MNRRIDRVNELLRQEISQLLSRQIKDPRLTGVISITQVKTTQDLRSARVFLSVMGDAEAKQDALDGIQSAAAYLRKELRDRLAMRYVPFLSFEVDNSIEEADQLLQIMDQLKDDPGSQAEMGHSAG
ncbi:MAG: ribosome-binding factor A [SAR202 cluster bacterium Io17-Chloro-G9]|nr:MAG: ribosome-binding factor A [SAR202 cluster bacterium Io17-Chloro-G9]